MKLTLVGYIHMIKRDNWEPEQLDAHGKPVLTRELPVIIPKGEKYVPQYNRG